MSRTARTAMALSGASALLALLLSGCTASAIPAAPGYLDPAEPEQAAEADPVPVPAGADPENPAVETDDSGYLVPGSPYSGERALDVLDSLPVLPAQDDSGYEPAAFGEDGAGGPGCGTRHRILLRDLTDPRTDEADRCRVTGGDLYDPYTGDVIGYADDPDEPAPIAIDRIVSLRQAWMTGAQELDAEQREALARDPLNLQATSRAAYRDKAGNDAQAWLPLWESYHCTYAARQISIKQHHGLWVTAGEKSTLSDVLATCPGQRAFAPTAADSHS